MTALRVLLTVRAFWFSKKLRFRRGGVALIISLASPILIGFTGFSVDASLWSAQHIALQTATDFAAIKAASDINSNPGITNASLVADAVAAANAAQSGQILLSSANLTVTQLVDQRQVQVSATIPAVKYFTRIYPFSYNISTSSTAGVSYPLVSNQATCYSVDSYTYLYSTGFGTIDTSHSSGIDPYKCASPPAAPAVYDSYCGGGVLGCSLDLLNAGNFLLPFAIQLGPRGGAGGLAVVEAPVVNTLTALLAASGYGAASSMTMIGPGSPQCTNNVCNVPAGVYNGGLTIAPNVTVNFVPSGGSDNFIIENGNFVVSNQDTLGASNDSHAVFYLGGAAPGGFVEATQIDLNTAPVSAGSILLSSTSSFSSGSIIGTQTSAPLAAMPYAQSQAETQGFLSALGTPGQNLAGTNFESVVAVCAQATSTCASPEGESAVFQSTLLPSVGILSSLLPGITPVDLLANEGEVSTTTINSGVTFANGVPTDWQQQESASSKLTNVVQTVPGVISYLGLSPLLAAVVSPVLQPLLNAIAPNETNTQNYADSGVFPGQTSTGAPGCGGQPILYSAAISPGFSPGFSDILNTAGENGANGALTTSDNITVCGQSPTASVTVLGSGSRLVNNLAAGSSSILLLQ